jgi:hypothetical protein
MVDLLSKGGIRTGRLQNILQNRTVNEPHSDFPKPFSDNGLRR